MKNYTYYVRKGGNAWRILSLLSLSALITVTTHSQNTGNSAPAKTWLQMMRDPKAKIQDVQKAFNDWYNSKHPDKLKGKLSHKTGEKVGNKDDDDDAYSQFKRWEWFNIARADNQGNRGNQHVVNAQYRNFLHTGLGNSSSQCSASNGGWLYVGNTTVPVYNTSYTSSEYGGDGRVDRVRFMPGNSNIMFACTPAGGLWKTIDGGANWSTNTDQLGDLFTCDIAIDPTNTNIMYLATGDGDGVYIGDLGDFNTPGTIGVLKSMDGGNTWNATSLTSALDTSSTNFDVVEEIVIDPKNTSVVLAATTFGIWRSTNYGTTWTRTQPGIFHSMEFQPNNPNVVYAATQNLFAPGTGGFYRSTDNGKTWTQINAGLPASANVDRMQIGVSPANPNVVYLLTDSITTTGFEGLYRSNNQGLTFTTVANYITSNDLLGWNCQPQIGQEDDDG